MLVLFFFVVLCHFLLHFVVSLEQPEGITEPNIWFGFYLGVLSESSNLTTLYLASDLHDAIKAQKFGQKSLLNVADIFFNETCLLPDWKKSWEDFSQKFDPFLNNGTLLGFFLGDEAVWGCISMTDFEIMANAVKERFPDAITWVNEAPPVLSDHVDSCGNRVNYTFGLTTWFSVDKYHDLGPDPKFVNGIVKGFYETNIFPNVEEVVLVPGSFGSKDNPDCDLRCYDEMCQMDAEEYVDWALSDHRVKAVIPFHWMDCQPSWPCKDCEIGTVSMNGLKKKWKSLSEELR